VATRRLDQSWQYDFTLEGHGRQRKAGFRTKVEAREAERRKREELISGQKRFLMANAYRMYVSATTMKPGSRDDCTRLWRDLESQLGHKSAKSTHQFVFVQCSARCSASNSRRVAR
jgi:hypothetical protein